MPPLNNVIVRLLPKFTAYLLQPLDEGIKSVVKKGYSRKLDERAVALIDDGDEDGMYEVVVLQSIKWVYRIWRSMDRILCIILGRKRFRSQSIEMVNDLQV